MPRSVLILILYNDVYNDLGSFLCIPATAGTNGTDIAQS